MILGILAALWGTAVGVVLTNRRWRKRMADLETCLFCDETIADGEARFPMGEMRFEESGPVIGVRHVHRECMMRQVIGGVGHLLGKCHCPDGTGEFEDPPGMTKREAAIATATAWEAARNGRSN